MNVSRDVILDLLPLVVADEASEDTTALVEQFLATDPALVKLAEEMKSHILIKLPNILQKEIEMQTFEETKNMLKRRNLFLSFALLFTGLTVAFRFGETGIEWFWVNTPGMAVVCFFLGLMAWIGYLLTIRQTRKGGW